MACIVRDKGIAADEFVFHSYGKISQRRTVIARYLITGGAGFIGSAMALRLLQENHEVHIIDLEERIELVRDRLNRASFHCGNISDKDSFSTLPKGDYEVAFHMAAQTSARVSEESPDLDIDSNVKGTYYFCKWARKSKPRRAVFTSSMAVYGSHGDNIDENTARRPVSVYGITKKTGEDLFRILSEDGINTTVYRLFNVYGPGQDFTNMQQGMLSIFMTQALTSDAIRVTGSLNRYRDFVYIDDVLNALLINDNRMGSGVINVGSGTPTSVNELCNIIINKTKSINGQVPIIEIASHRGDVFGNFSNSEKLLSLGWQPTTGLDKGIELMLPSAIEALLSK
jgi:UDP-glucose 4-epimerase